MEMSTGKILPQMDGLPLSTNGGQKSHTVHPRKHTIRFVFRSLSFMALIGLYAVVGYLNRGTDGDAFLKHDRDLAEEVAPCPTKLDPVWLLAPYILVIIYMFLALAIVCDEFFVPALEEMSGPRQLNLGMDIAGATIMAAGGSAPELFTSFFGTFDENLLGFGTIVGSAVFNVLFVIGMCSLLSYEVLELTWWPLFRDSIYYIIGLSVLAIFVAVVSPNEIHIWEAVVLFVMYIGYCVLMAYNQRLYGFINTKILRRTAEDNDSPEIAGVADDGSSVEVDVDQIIDQRELEDARESNGRVLASSKSQANVVDFRWPGTFRTGVVSLLTKPESWKYRAGAGLVAHIKGDVNEVFAQVDKDNSDTISKEELVIVLKDLNITMTEEEFEELYKELDEDENGQIDKKEFEIWYLHSQERMMKDIEKIFTDLDKNKDGKLNREEIKELLNTVSNPTDEEVSGAIEEMYETGNHDEITYEEFVNWYKGSLVYQNEREALGEESDGIFSSLRPPKTGSSWWSYLSWLILLPIVVTLAFTVPDIRRAGCSSKFCYISFLLSIIWIGVYSLVMVEATTAVGATLGIPDVIMGLTFLAAGTSVPDLLSSVIVARQGRGDMAVSSSIGSNIFDILVGLPLPWLVFTLWPTKPNVVKIGSDGIAISIAILVVMIFLIILTIHLSKWKLTKCAGWMMFVFYAGFLVQGILTELPVPDC